MTLAVEILRRLLLLLIAAVCLGAAAANAQADRFSHQLHLGKVGLTCTTCHASAETSEAATDRNLPQPETCMSCHDGGAAPEIDVSWLAAEPIEERTFRFNHQFHLQMGNPAPVILAAIEDGKYYGYHHYEKSALETGSACQACHRGLEETTLAGKANLPQMADCLACHNKVDNPFSCEKCHLDGVDLKPADHTADFIDRHSSRKMKMDKTTCLPCHGRNFGCMGCH
jgi:predicted CXXCH cytochrome family protein